MEMYPYVVLGVLVSVALPAVRSVVPNPIRTLRDKEFWKAFWPYVATGVFSLLAAVVIIAASEEGQLNTWKKAFLAGYFVDASLQKLGPGRVGR